MDKLFYLFLAYTLIWALIFWYTWRLMKRQTKVEQELALVRKLIQCKSDSDPNL